MPLGCALQVVPFPFRMVPCSPTAQMLWASDPYTLLSWLLVLSACGIQTVAATLSNNVLYMCPLAFKYQSIRDGFDSATSSRCPDVHAATEASAWLRLA